MLVNCPFTGKYERIIEVVDVFPWVTPCDRFSSCKQVKYKKYEISKCMLKIKSSRRNSKAFYARFAAVCFNRKYEKIFSKLQKINSLQIRFCMSQGQFASTTLGMRFMDFFSLSHQNLTCCSLYTQKRCIQAYFIKIRKQYFFELGEYLWGWSIVTVSKN